MHRRKSDRATLNIERKERNMTLRFFKPVVAGSTMVILGAITSGARAPAAPCSRPLTRTKPNSRLRSAPHRRPGARRPRPSRRAKPAKDPEHRLVRWLNDLLVREPRGPLRKEWPAHSRPTRAQT